MRVLWLLGMRFQTFDSVASSSVDGISIKLYIREDIENRGDLIIYPLIHYICIYFVSPFLGQNYSWNSNKSRSQLSFSFSLIAIFGKRDVLSSSSGYI